MKLVKFCAFFMRLNFISFRYKVKSVDRTSLRTHIVVDIGSPPLKLQKLMDAINKDSTISESSCVQSLIWMYNKFMNV